MGTGQLLEITSRILWPLRLLPYPWGDLDHTEPPTLPCCPQWARASCPQAEAAWQWWVGARTCPAYFCCLAWSVFSSGLFVLGRGSNCGQALWARQPLAPAACLTGSSFSDSRQAQPLISWPSRLLAGALCPYTCSNPPKEDKAQGCFTAHTLLPVPSLFLQAHHPGGCLLSHPSTQART